RMLRSVPHSPEAGTFDLRRGAQRLHDGTLATRSRDDRIPAATPLPIEPTTDPSILVYRLREKGLDADQLDHALHDASCLLGVSGVSSEMHQVRAAMAQQANARLAVDVDVHRIRHTVGGMAATLGGSEALVGTAGVEAQAAVIRAQVCEHLGSLDLILDRTA